MLQVQHNQRGHAVLSPSSAARWIACTPSARFTEGYPDETSAAAEEGTRAHEIAELVLRHWLEGSYSVESETIIADMARAIGLETCDDATLEMLECAIGYADYIKANVVETLESASRQIAIETRLDLGLLVPDAFGTADCYAHDERRLHVVDYKYGKGVEVSAIENPQMMIYALGCLDDVFVRTGRETIEEVVLHIYQPRARNRSTYHVSVEALQLWANEVLAPRADMAHRGEGTFTAGEHCRFCRAKTDCKTYTEMILSAEVQAYHEANKLSPDELGAALTRAERLAGWIDEAKERASKLISGGISVKGYKLVRGRSTRFFHDEAEAGAALRALGYGDEQLYKTSLISVAGAEKLLGKKCFSESLSHLVGTKEGSPTLAPESDKRASIDLFE